MQRTWSDRLRPWIPAFFWVALIAWESSGLFSASNTSHWLRAILTTLFGPVNPKWFVLGNDVLRKVGHFTGYAILSYFWYRGWRNRYFSKRGILTGQLRIWHGSLTQVWKMRWAVLSVLLTAAVASADEFHQWFVPGRTGNWHDVVLDTLGAIFAQLLVLAWTPTFRLREQQPAEKQPVS